MNSRPFLPSLLRLPEFWLLLGGVIVQMLVLVGFSRSPYFLPDSGDSKFYNEWALRIARGHWSDGHAFYGLPGYAYILAAIYSVAGFDPFLIGLIQAVIMALVAVLILRISRLVFQSRSDEPNADLNRWRPVVVGVVAGLGWIFFQPANAFSVVLMPTVWLVLAYWGCVWWVARMHAATVWKPWLLMGVCVGAVAMLVATILFVLPLMLAAIVLTLVPGAPLRLRLPRILMAAGVLISGVVAGASPAWIHNYLIVRDPVFLSAHGGVNFYIGNNAEANGYPKMPRGLRATQEGSLSDSILIPETEAGRKLKRSEVSRYWSEKASAWIGANPLDWMGLLGLKFRNAWNAFQYDDIGIVTLLVSKGLVPPGIQFGLVAIFGLPGLIWGLWAFPRARWISFAVLLHMAALMPAFITERYRLAAVPGLLLLGSFWLWQGLNVVIMRQWARGLGWLAVTIAALWFVTIPQTDVAALTLDDHNMGVRALRVGDLELAERALVRAHKYMPDSAETNFALGNLWLATGNLQEAKRAYRHALQLDPSNGGVWNNLGIIAMRQELWEDAAKLFRASISREPDEAKTHYLLAQAYSELGRIEEGRAAIANALRLKPKQREFLELQQRLSVPSGGVPLGDGVERD